MGIALSFLPFLDSCHRHGAFLSPLLALGSQELHDTEKDIASFAVKHSYATLLQEKTVRSLFLDRYGIQCYLDCDLNNKASLTIDLTRRIDAVGKLRPGTILNAGTIEHVFDVAAALANIHDMLCPGGTVVHISPVTWYDHGFFNLNPMLFESIIKTNNYVLVAEGFWVPSRPSFLSRIGFTSSKPEPQLLLAGPGQQAQQSSEIGARLFKGAFLPANCLHMICYRKPHAETFKVPYDISP